MIARTLRALVGCSDNLRAAYLSVDDAALQAEIRRIADEVQTVIGLVVVGETKAEERAS